MVIFICIYFDLVVYDVNKCFVFYGIVNIFLWKERKLVIIFSSFVDIDICFLFMSLDMYFFDIFIVIINYGIFKYF